MIAAVLGVLAGLIPFLTAILEMVRVHEQQTAPRKEEEATDAAIQSHEPGREAALLQRVADRVQRRRAEQAAAPRQ